MPSLYNKTPLVQQTFTDGESDSPQFFIKSEFSQPGGSFKSRGIGYLISKSAARIEEGSGKPPHVYCSSGGNAGLAAATASEILRLPCTVVVPRTTKESMISKIRDRGAEVIVKGSHWKEADFHLCESIIKSAEGSKHVPIYVHPFDNSEIWDGHSSIVDEIIESLKSEHIDLDRLKGIVCSVGGGGLFNGVIRGLERHNLAHQVPVVAVETKGCDVLNASLRAGHQVTLEKITSVASSLGSVYTPKETFDYATKYNTKSVVLDDIAVLETCLKYAQSNNVAVEPACGASIHLAYNPDILEHALGTSLKKYDVIVVIACGGSAVTTEEVSRTLSVLKNEK